MAVLRSSIIRRPYQLVSPIAIALTANKTIVQEAIGETVRLTATAASPLSFPVTFAIGLSGGSSGDFQPNAGAITIAAGQTTGFLDYVAINDGIAEGAETVTFSATAPGTLSKRFTSNTVSVQIIEVAPVNGTLSVSPTSVSEPLMNGATIVVPGGTVRLTLTLAQSLPITIVAPITVSSPADFQANAGTITIVAGQVSGFLDYVVAGDILAEGTETITFSLGTIAAVNPANTASVQIIEYQPIAVVLSANKTIVSEINDSVRLTATAAAAVPITVTLPIVLTGASTADFQSNTGAITIVGGQTSGFIDYVAAHDGITEGTETATFTLQPDSLGVVIASGSVNVQIVEVTPVQVVSMTRDAATNIITVTFNRDVTGVDIGDFTLTRDGSAVSLTGILPGTIPALQATLTRTGSSITVTFNRDVTGVTISDFTLTKDGSPVSLTGITVN